MYIFGFLFCCVISFVCLPFNVGWLAMISSWLGRRCNAGTLLIKRADSVLTRARSRSKRKRTHKVSHTESKIVNEWATCVIIRKETTHRDRCAARTAAHTESRTTHNTRNETKRNEMKDTRSSVGANHSLYHIIASFYIVAFVNTQLIYISSTLFLFLPC